MKYVTKEQLKAEIRKITGARFTSFVAETEVDMRKTDNPYMGATKVSHIIGNLGPDYGNSVNNLKERNGQDRDFTPQAHKWAEHTDCKHFLTDRKTHTKSYLVVYPRHKSREAIEAKPTKYFFGGQEIDKALLEPFMPAFRPSASGIEYRTYGFDSIVSMVLGDGENKEEYIVVEPLSTSSKEAATTPEAVTVEA